MTSDLDIVRHPRARRAKLSVDPASGRVRLTLPHRAPLKAALRWAEDHRDWIAAQQARLPQARPFAPGVVIPCGDDELTIVWRADSPRRIERVGRELRCGGPIESLSRRIATWLRREALRTLEEETTRSAARAGVTIDKVAVGDPKGRWGSCTSNGAIRYSWRLILAPSHVLRSTVAHEVAHRVHMNHSAEFHALAATIDPGDPAASRAWLRHHGAALHWLGRES